MAYSNLAVELNFCNLPIDDVFPNSGVLASLKRYEKVLEVYVNDPANQNHPLPSKITKDRVVNNELIRKWAAFKAPPLLLDLICGGLPPSGDVAVRVREIMRACILASSPEYQQKPYGEILSVIVRMGGAIKHLAADKASMFSHIHTYTVEVEVLRDEAARAVSHMEQGREGIRIDLSTSVLEVVNHVNHVNFFDMSVVANNTEVPHHAITTTRTEMWYTANQDYYNRMPGNTSQDGDHSHLLDEAQLQRLCGIMYEFAKQVGYGLRTYNREVGPSSSSDSGVINIHHCSRGCLLAWTAHWGLR